MTRLTPLRAIGLALVALTLNMAAARESGADGFISPLIGYNFGGDANCPAITGCEDKRINWGVAFGAMNAVLGIEEELAYTSNFFGEAPGLSSSVLTVMTNVMLAPAIGPVRPYVLAGVGLIKTDVELSPSSLLTTSNNSFGWDAGGGLMVLFSDHVGVRGDVRYFRAFQDQTLLGISLGDTKLGFGRVAGALLVTF
jgi:opacity protein-like surface antigen